MLDTLRFGASLARLRKKSGLTQAALADRLHVTRQAVSKYELGRSFPDVTVLLALARVFSVPPGELLRPLQASGEESGGPARLAERLAAEGIDAAGVAELARSLNAPESADGSREELLKKLLPFLDGEAKYRLFVQVLERRLDERFLGALLPYAEELISLIEAAVVCGALSENALGIIRRYQLG